MAEPTVDLTNLPPRDGDAPLHELSLDQLSVFLYVSFTGAELLELLRALGVALKGGYRLESLGDAERADVLAGELIDFPKARKLVIAKLVELYEWPALDGVVLPKLVAEEVALLAAQPDATVRMLWRLLADPSKEVRGSARMGLELLVEDFYGRGPVPAGGPNISAKPAAGPAAAPPTAPAADAPDLRELRKEARRAGAMADRAREKAGSLKEQLREARAEVSTLEREVAAKTKESARLGTELERAKVKLAEARKERGHDEAEKLEKDRADLAQRVATLEDRAKSYAEERARLEEQNAALTRQLAQRPSTDAAKPPKSEDAESAVEELPSTWLFPKFTREFYDSLDRWEPRIQRTAFKQAFLLAENHRHPSLRAIPLEGIPGYFRVRIATDVRLIYRRTDSERDVEILSLIDREDLDRYVRQAKTR